MTQPLRYRTALIVGRAPTSLRHSAVSWPAEGRVVWTATSARMQSRRRTLLCFDNHGMREVAKLSAALGGDEGHHTR